MGIEEKFGKIVCTAEPDKRNDPLGEYQECYCIKGRELVHIAYKKENHSEIALHRKINLRKKDIDKISSMGDSSDFLKYLYVSGLFQAQATRDIVNWLDNPDYEPKIKLMAGSMPYYK